MEEYGSLASQEDIGTLSQVSTHMGSPPNIQLRHELQDDMGAGQLESRKYLLLDDGVLTT